MPGRTIFLGPNPNDFVWSIPRGRGSQFEKLVERYLKLHVATRDGSVSIHPTKRVGDEGRDFEIEFTGTVELFGFTIGAATVDSRGTVFVECKATERDRLDDAFLIDASQHSDHQAAAYVLVTNSVITPYCQYRAQQDWQRRGSKFCLVDRRRLTDLIYRHDLTTEAQRLQIPLPECPHLPVFDARGLVVSCQADHHTLTNSQTVLVYIALANHGETSILADLRLATDLLWAVREGPYERIVMPGMLETLTIAAERQELDGIAELGLQLSVNGRSTRLSVASAKFDLALDPQFIGEGHNRLVIELRKRIEEASGFLLVSLRGDAGVGKTRTVREALYPLSKGNFQVFAYPFTRHGLSDTKDFERDIGRIPAGDASSRLGALMSIAADSGVPIALHFEDLHHADDDIIEIFKNAVLNPPLCRSSLVIILGGRDDHTFPNEAYYSLLQLIADEAREHVLSCALTPLSSADARTLIKSVVVNMPEPGVDRVQALGQNNPFIILEMLQYLLDSRLAQLLSRRTIGILDPEAFAGRQGLPESIEDLYNKRFESLRQAGGGELAAQFLIAASFFGLIIDEELRASFFDGDDEGSKCWSLLRVRRFVHQDIDPDQGAFAHENLLHYLRRWSRRDENARFASSLVLEQPGLCKRLSLLDRGEAYCLHREFALALRCFDAPCTRINAVTNFSSEEIDRRYFTYLPGLFRAAKEMGRPADFLAKVALAYGYMGVHNFPLVVAESACKQALAMLGEVYPEEKNGRHEKLAVAQLRAHALQNMGKTSRALQAMLEIEAELRDCQPWPDLSFDLYDRLSEYYRKINHSCLMDVYDRLAKRCVTLAKDRKLVASHLITHAGAGLFGGVQEARRRAAAAHQAAKNSKIQRFITFTRLSELVVECLYSRQDADILRDVAEEARHMLRHAVVESFADSIMRLELLLGTIALYIEDNPAAAHARARLYIESGQANSVRYGNGLFDWAFDNLAAVIDREDPTRPHEQVRERFRSCLERLRRRGLTFLGAVSGTYPNAFAISNVVRFIGSYEESKALDIVQGSLSAYDCQFVDNERLAHDIVRRAIRGQAIFWPQRPSISMLRYPPETGYFTPVF